MKPVRWLLLVCLFMLASTSVTFAKESRLQKEYVFESESADFSYPAKETIRKKETTWHLNGIEYEILEETDRYQSRKETYTGLSEKQVPLKRVYRIQGKDMTLRADAEDVQYSEHTETWTQTLTGRTSPPQFTQTRDVVIEGKTYAATLVGTQQEDSPKPYTATVRFSGSPDADFYLDWGNGRKKLTLKQRNQEMGPAWNGYREDVLQYLKLPEGSTVGSGRWSSGWQEENGRSVRYATFTGTRPAANYTATYQYSTYDAVVTYHNDAEPGEKHYQVKAICTYEAEETPLWKVIAGIGAGILVAAACVVLIFYVLQRRKKEGAE